MRGLSTLIILKELISLVLQDLGRSDLLPRDVFDLVVGTSTGG